MPVNKKWYVNVCWWCCLAVFATGAGRLAQYAHLSGGWLLGALFAAIIMALSRQEHPRLSSRWLFTAHGVIGTAVAGMFNVTALPAVGGHWVMVFVVVGITLAVSIVSGILMPHISTLSKSTAAFGSLPGGANSMIAMSVDIGADTRMVALMQYTRLVLTLVAAVIMARLMQPQHPVLVAPVVTLPVHALASGNVWHTYIFTALLAALSVFAGRKFKIPAGAFIVPMITGMIASGLNWFHPAWPQVIVNASYIVVGIYVGVLFDKPSIRQAGRVFPLMIVNALVLMGVCALTAKLLCVVIGVDYLTGYLAATPGGLDTVNVIAMNSGANVSLVLAVQMVRLLAIILLGPLAIKLVSGLSAKGIRREPPEA